MRILVVNVGSSSVKLAVMDMPAGEEAFTAELSLRKQEVGDALAGLPMLLDAQGVRGIGAVAHRVTHGADRFHAATRIDAALIEALEMLGPLAPLHNPPAVAGIHVALRRWPQLPQIAVFDTAFHAGMPPRASTYAVPEEWRRGGVRRYGFHGTSHRYVMERVSLALAVPASELRIVSCHLGNGASVCAIERGVSIDTSMGMTPLEGLVMGSRPGDLDPGVAGHVQRTLGLTSAEFDDALYRRSGLAAFGGHGSDLREIETAAAGGDAQAELALDLYAYRARKYVGAYAAAMGGVDVLAFTGGIGENSAGMRQRICVRLEFLGLELDEAANAALRLDGFEAAQIQQAQSRMRIIVTRAREQWMIAREAYTLLADQRQSRTSGMSTP